MVLHHFEYTAEMCDCRYCPYYRGKRKCTASQCPCIEERIVAGAASRAEVMAETMRDIHNGAFRRRLNQFIKESEELHMNFRNEKHRLAFVEAIRKLDKKNFALMSALYLLTAEHKLWMQIRNYVERNEIKFERFKPKDSTENGYTVGHPLHRGHSLSVSDVVVNDNGAFFCDSIGFQPIAFDESQTQKPDNLMRVVYVEPHKAPYIADVAHTLEAEQKAVGDGLIEPIDNYDGTCLVGNEESKLRGMDGNRRIGDGSSIMAGPFFVCGDSGESFRSLTDEEVTRYMARFAEPEDISPEEVEADMGFMIYPM